MAKKKTAKKKTAVKRKTAKRAAPMSRPGDRLPVVKTPKVEYKVVQVPLDSELLLTSLQDLDVKRQYDMVIEKLLNEHAAEGWTMKMLSLNSVVLEREL